MVVLLDLEEDVLDPNADLRHGGGFADLKQQLSNGAVISNGIRGAIENEKEVESANLNINGFSAALRCYP